MKELTISQATKRPADFMYIWADEEKFLQKINAKYANIIRGKKLNQRKLIVLSAKKYGQTEKAYTDAIRQAFIDQFGVTPYDGLIMLAEGKVLAGKNWKEGVYGIGGISSTFKGTTYSVDPETGTLLDGDVPAPTSDIVYAEINGETIPYQIFCYDNVDNRTYMSQYNKIMKKYYAESYTNADGTTYKANGIASSGADAGTVWQTIIESLDVFLDWLFSLFGINVETETINADNTLPSQEADGFVQEAGMGEAGMILLALAAGGTLLATSGKTSGKKTK